MRLPTAGSVLRAILWFVYIFVLLEVAGLIYFHSPWAQPIGGFGYPKDIFVTKGDGMDYGYLPGFRGRFSGGTFNQIPLEINSDGYRDREFGAKTAGVPRLSVLGDSVVFGAGAASEHRFTERLQAELSKTRPTEVYNFGVNSYAFTNYVATMNSPRFRALQPDLIVIGLVMNDLGESGWPKDVAHGGVGWTEPLSFRIYNLAAVQFLVQLRDHVAYYLMTRSPEEQYHTKYMREMVKDWQDPGLLTTFRNDIVRARDIAAEIKAPLVVALMPELNILKQPKAFDLPRATAAQAFQEKGIPVCDLFPAFASHAPVDELFLPDDDMHFSTAGHLLVASSLQACLAKLNLVQTHP